MRVIVVLVLLALFCLQVVAQDAAGVRPPSSKTESEAGQVLNIGESEKLKFENFELKLSAIESRKLAIELQYRELVTQEQQIRSQKLQFEAGILSSHKAPPGWVIDWQKGRLVPPRPVAKAPDQSK